MSDGADDELLREARPSSGLAVADVVRELSAATLTGDGRVEVFGVQHDSRRIQPGDLFVARKGASYDGGRFAEKAVAQGARAILAPPDVVLPEAGVPVIRTSDLRRDFALAAAAVYGHPSFFLDMVGVTGTNGKTTTTHLVRAAVDGASSGSVCGVVGTVGHTFAGRTVAASHTTPEADELARVLAVMKKRGATHVAMEVSSIALVLGRVEAVRFRVAAFTNLTQDHLDFHGTMDAYAAAKATLFTELGPGLAVINTSDPFGARLAKDARCKVLTVSTTEGDRGADLAPVRVVASANGMHVVARTPAGEVEIPTRLFGRHNVENLLVALGVAVALDLDPQRAAEGLAREGGAPGRLERCDEPGDDVIVLVDYAHTPDAIERVLAAVREARKAASAPGRILAVFGCGGDRDPKKRAPMGHAAGAGADVAILTSDNPRTEDPAAIAVPVEEGVRASGQRPVNAHDLKAGAHGYVVELDRARAIALAVDAARPGDVVVVLGKGHEDYQVIGTEKRPFDDRDEARRALAARRTQAEER